MKKIFSVSDLVGILKSAKCGGQYVALYGESDYKLNKFPTDGSERIRIKDGFQPRKKFVVKFHFGEDYERKMSKMLGEEYKASDKNRIHLVKNVLMQFASTGTTCVIYMPESYTDNGIYLNGQPISEEDLAYAKRYKSPTKASAIEYRNLNVTNVERIAVGGETYEVCIGQAQQTAVA